MNQTTPSTTTKMTTKTTKPTKPINIRNDTKKLYNALSKILKVTEISFRFETNYESGHNEKFDITVFYDSSKGKYDNFSII
jgi:hypothetical protein